MEDVAQQEAYDGLLETMFGASGERGERAAAAMSRNSNLVPLLAGGCVGQARALARRHLALMRKARELNAQEAALKAREDALEEDEEALEEFSRELRGYSDSLDERESLLEEMFPADRAPVEGRPAALRNNLALGAPLRDGSPMPCDDASNGSREALTA